jgi:2-polyprenyl-3-methyl-5-hydroxy-6-metoxy-1,4-benzoquinol methylase
MARRLIHSWLRRDHGRSAKKTPGFRWMQVAMTNPWLEVPASDYIGHMSSREVAQYQALNRNFAETLAVIRPGEVLVLGCAMGNGFEHVDPRVTSRVVGVDLNLDYLQRAVDRFSSPGFVLEVHCADLAEYSFEQEAFDLVHAALVFEYIPWIAILPRVIASLRRDGVLSVVLQRPSRTSPAVTQTRFVTLRALESLFRFVDPDVLVSAATRLGVHLECRHTETLPGDKAFEVLRFRRF